MVEEKEVLSEDEVGGDNRMVPVVESIKYRKRAQSAEKQLAEVQGQLDDVKTENEKLSKRIGSFEIERNLSGELIKAGISDVEAGVILARSELEKDVEADVSEIVEKLKNEKGYLFDSGNEEKVDVSSSVKTSGVKQKVSGGRAVIERYAKRAAESGSRADMMEYLRVRRQYK
jgi:hypothetical protein